MVGVAVKVTKVPEQTLLEVAVTDTEGVTVVPTVIVTALEVAVVVAAQDALDVSTQVTTSLLANVVDE